MDFLADEGAAFEQAFWTATDVWNIDRDKGVLTRVTESFIGNGRAMDILMLVGHEMKKLDTEICYSVLEAVLSESASGKKLSDYGSSSYYVEKIFEYLAEEVEDTALRETFLALAQEEAKHKLRFEIEYDDVILREN